MIERKNYIATWFYKENAAEASFYPQAGGRGDSPLLHSVYMQIQVPFFITFHHYNPEAVFLFFTNLQPTDLPRYLTSLFERLKVKIVTLPYTHRPPKGWHIAFQNQFYLYDILDWMSSHMEEDDAVLVSDADCLCRHSLAGLFAHVKSMGSSLYEMDYAEDAVINGTTQAQLGEFYQAMYGEKPSCKMKYYGGEFIAMKGNFVKMINKEFPALWKFNLSLHEDGPRLREEAHVMSVLAERAGMRNDNANGYVKRMWTIPRFNNVTIGDEDLAVWHMPYEKKRGLYHLYKIFEKDEHAMDRPCFWIKAGRLCGIPHVSAGKKVHDNLTLAMLKFRNWWRSRK